MIDAVFASSPLASPAPSTLLSSIAHKRTLWGPRVDEDGLCRLQVLKEGSFPDLALPTFIPLKKILLPPRDPVWTYRAGRFCAAEEPAPLAVLGVPLCDLQAVWYLDQAFADDKRYQKRRSKCLLVGMPCEPGPECHCNSQLMPISGDIFISQERAWALSPAGKELLQTSGCTLLEEKPLPWPVSGKEQGFNLTLDQYTASGNAAIWEEEAKRCLSCGACSAVCPTCYCFDMLDDAALNGTVTRNRVWDNCFFAEHGKVAGNYDFRPGRANRLRFRMEHKAFGFGSLRGQNSCVGCGRCRTACPVDIDLDRIATRLSEEGGK